MKFFRYICLSLFVFMMFSTETLATSVVLIDGDNMEILHGENENVLLPMASTTKIMTAIIALENTDITREILVKPEYTYVEGSSMYLEAEEVLTIEELLYGLMLMSGNDSAIAIAHETTGDYNEFIELMNQKAQNLGLNNTSFSNPNGLDADEHYTTAYELAILTAYALKNEQFCEIVSSKYYKSETRTMKNHNKLLWEDDSYIGVKTGYTSNAGRCLVSAISSGDKKLVSVTLDCSDDWNIHEKLYNEYLLKYNKYNFYTKDEFYDIIKVMSGNVGETTVHVLENVNLLLTNEQKQRVQTQVLAPKIVYAPIKSGDVYGEVLFILDDIEIYRTNLIYNENISLEQSDDMNFFDKFIDFIKNLFY